MNIHLANQWCFQLHSDGDNWQGTDDVDAMITSARGIRTCRTKQNVEKNMQENSAISIRVAANHIMMHARAVVRLLSFMQKLK